MVMMDGGYQRYSGPQFPHRSITPLLGGLLVLSALNGNSYFFPPEDPLYADYYNLWNNGYNGGFGNQYGGGFGGPYGNRLGNQYGGYGIWNPWYPGFSLLGALLTAGRRPRVRGFFSGRRRR